MALQLDGESIEIIDAHTHMGGRKPSGWLTIGNRNQASFVPILVEAQQENLHTVLSGQ
jgi:hypothetical protein